LTSESADLQECCGAPGWNRTSDTRFRNHAEGVTGGSASCANVLHSPRFCDVSVMGRAQPCWAVVRRLVGIASAIIPNESALDAPRRPTPTPSPDSPSNITRNGVGVDPVSWTPKHWGPQSPGRASAWAGPDHHARPSFAARRCAWCAPRRITAMLGKASPRKMNWLVPWSAERSTAARVEAAAAVGLPPPSIDRREAASRFARALPAVVPQ
jgi:hypothetical protein